MQTHPPIITFLDELRALHHPERAAQHQRYHKSSREHWGIPMPECEKRAKAFAENIPLDHLLSAAKALWETNLFDPMMCAGKILCMRKVKPSAELWNTIRHFLTYVDGWALEDLLAHAAWKCIGANEKLLDEVELWTQHENFWMRRAALVYTLPFAKPGQNPERMLGWASKYAGDNEWFIQKAIGWWLRVLGEHNPERVCEFLRGHWHQLKGVARKEATRKLKTDERKSILEAVSVPKQ